MSGYNGHHMYGANNYPWDEPAHNNDSAGGWMKPTSHGHHGSHEQILRKPTTTVRYSYGSNNGNTKTYVTESETVVERVYVKPVEYRYTIAKPHQQLPRRGFEDDTEDVTKFFSKVLSDVGKPLKDHVDHNYHHREEEKWRGPSSPSHDRRSYLYPEPSMIISRPGSDPARQVRPTWVSTQPGRTRLSSPTNDIDTAMGYLLDAAGAGRGPSYNNYRTVSSDMPMREFYREVREFSGSGSPKNGYFTRQPVENMSYGYGDGEMIMRNSSSDHVSSPKTNFGRHHVPYSAPKEAIDDYRSEAPKSPPVVSHSPHHFSSSEPKEAINYGKNEAPKLSAPMGSPPKTTTTQFGMSPSHHFSSEPKGDVYDKNAINGKNYEAPKSAAQMASPPPKTTSSQFGMFHSSHPFSSEPKGDVYNKDAINGKNEAPKSTVPVASPPKASTQLFGMFPSHHSSDHQPKKGHAYSKDAIDGNSESPKSMPPSPAWKRSDDYNKETINRSTEAPRSPTMAGFGMVPPPRSSSSPKGDGYNSGARREANKDTIDSREAAKRYGDHKNNSRSYSYRNNHDEEDDEDDGSPVINSREAVKRYNGTFVP